MLSLPVLTPPVPSRLRSRTALVTSADRSFRQRLNATLTGLRWQVREAEGGAEAWTEARASAPEAIIVDSWLPDLDVGEFLHDFQKDFPEVDLISTGGSPLEESARGPYRQELLYALRRCQESDTAAWNAAPALDRLKEPSALPPVVPAQTTEGRAAASPVTASRVASADRPVTGSSQPAAEHIGAEVGKSGRTQRLPEMIGEARVMLEVSRRVRLVAARTTPVLIEGPTGSGKELVAQALHALSSRSKKPFITINCAAIPEALLEAELFGHTRGAFTGAVQSRVGRIEAANGGTLFLDEIGEMPLALQSKLLRFVESGELQRVGDNEPVKVDVRIVAATHQPLGQHTQEGRFRADLYYRLAVFLIRTPALVDHAEDIPLLIEHFLERMGRQAPVKRIDAGARSKLTAHPWPGNVRELEHVLERAAILAGEETVVTAAEIDFGTTIN